jgi:hypothetical protein
MAAIEKFHGMTKVMAVRITLRASLNSLMSRNSSSVSDFLLEDLFALLLILNIFIDSFVLAGLAISVHPLADTYPAKPIDPIS